MGNISRLTFTETFERAKTLIRDGATTSAAEDKYKGIYNDIYINELPLIADVEYLNTSSAFSTGDDYTTGTIEVHTNSTGVCGSGTTFTASHSDYLFKVTNDGQVYTFSFESTTSATLGREFTGTTISDASYTLWKEKYSLGADFGNFPDGVNEAMYYYEGGQRTYLKEADETTWADKYSTIPGDPTHYKLSNTQDSNDCEEVLITPPTDNDIYIHYDYRKQLVGLSEYITGTASAATGDATISGNGTAWDGNLDTSNYTYYFRFDDDGTGASSVWYKITDAVSACAATISPSYAGSEKADVNYTVSPIPKTPAKLDLYLLYKICANGIANQSDPLYQYYFGLANGVLVKYINKQAARTPKRLKTIYETSKVARK